MSHDDCALCLFISEFVGSPGSRFPFEIHADVEEVETLPGMRFVGGIRVRGDAFAQMGTLYVEAEVATTVERPCGRCLETVRAPVCRQETFEAAIPLGADEIDLLPQTLAVILSSLVAHPLCRADCRGLCPGCGADLNAEASHRCRGRREDGRRLGDLLT
jgi:uncharacterized protein